MVHALIRCDKFERWLNLTILTESCKSNTCTRHSLHRPAKNNWISKIHSGSGVFYLSTYDIYTYAKIPFPTPITLNFNKVNKVNCNEAPIMTISIKDFDNHEVCIWLNAIGLGSKIEPFRESAVDGDLLCSLNLDDLTGDLSLSGLQVCQVSVGARRNRKTPRCIVALFTFINTRLSSSTGQESPPKH